LGVELRHIQHFVAVANAGNFTRAASHVHIVQSGLSASVQALERELGVPLFLRNGRTVVLTDAGRAFLPEARKVLAAVDAARDAVLDVKGGLRGTVRVGIMSAMALPQLTDVLAEFARERPQVLVVPMIEPAGSDEFVRALLEDRLDVAFTALPLARYPDGVTVIPLTTIELLLALPEGHRLCSDRPVELSQLDGQTFIEYPPGWGIRQEMDLLFARHGVVRESSLEVSDIPTVLDLVARGAGGAFVIPSTVAGCDGLRLMTVSPSPHLQVSLAIRTATTQRATTVDFVHAVLRLFNADEVQPL
jgi:DNA-binding transcriptional LysR family regulator